MRSALVALLLLAALHPMMTVVPALDEENPLLAAGHGVEVIEEVEPNNVNTSGQEVYPGDVVRGSVDMWDDKRDWFSVWLEPGQTLLLTLSHASGDGVSMSVWDEENTHYNTTNPAKTRDTIFLGEDETEVGGVYSVSVNATMTEAGGGAYVLEIDAGYDVQWYAPSVGWYVAADTYDAYGNVLYTSTLSDFQFANAATTDTQSAPVWSTNDFWNFSVTMPEFMGVSYEEYHQMTVTGEDTVSGKACYRVSLVGKATFSMDMMGTQMTTVDEETGEACYAKDTLALVHENITVTSSMEMSGGIGATSDTSGRSCTVDDGFGPEPDEDCDGVSDDWDICPGTASGATVDEWGCSEAQNGGGGGGGEDDTDGDGVNDQDDDCPNTPAGESVDFAGCSESQNSGGGGGGGGGGGSGGGGTGGGGSIEDGCIPDGIDQSTSMTMDLIYAEGMNELNFPLTEGKVWSEAAEGSGSMSMQVLMGGCTLLDIAFEDSGALPLNYRHLGTQSFTVDTTAHTATGIQSFAGREGNDDWSTPDFTLLPSVPDDVAKFGLPFAVWLNVVGFNEFSESVDISATVNDPAASVYYDQTTLAVNDLGAVIVDTMNLSSGDYELTVTGTQDGRDRSFTVTFTVDNTPDFEIQTMDPWIVLPRGVPWVVPTPIFIEPVNGFGADVTLSAVVPDGVTAELDFASGTAPFMAVLSLTISDSLPEGDYTVVVSGASGDTVRSDEITFSVTSLPEFSLDIDNREQLLTTGTMTVSGVINAHNGLDLSLGGMLDVIVEPYNQALLDSAVITWGAIDANGDLAFTVTFTVPDDLPQHEYTVQLNVVTLDGGVAHAASVAFVTESSTLDGTAVAAGENAVVSGDTSSHDGTNTAAVDVGGDGTTNNDGQGDTTNDGSDTSDSESQSSNTMLIAGSAIGVLGIIIGVAVVVLRGRNDGGGKDFGDQLWNDGSAGAMDLPSVQPMMQQPVQPVMQQPVQPVVQQPVQPVMQQPVQPVVQQPIQTAPAPPVMATAPPPPAQPMTVADYTGLPPGGTYDQSTGQTIYVQPDGVRWQMMGDGSFNR
ncbi:MAG: hypothetical protein VW102_07750, partial [Poseidonia sp.]